LAKHRASGIAGCEAHVHILIFNGCAAAIALWHNTIANAKEEGTTKDICCYWTNDNIT